MCILSFSPHNLGNGIIVCATDEETESDGSVMCPPAECASSRARDLNTGPFDQTLPKDPTGP